MDNTEHERDAETYEEYELAENTSDEMETNIGRGKKDNKDEYDNKNKFREKAERKHNERKSTCVTGLKDDRNKPTTKALERVIGNTNETFSTKYTSERDYDLLTNLCNGQETFDKFRDWMKHEKGERIKKTPEPIITNSTRTGNHTQEKR